HAMSEVISSADFQSKVLDAQEPVLVDFFATWCGPCKMLAPTLDEVAQAVEGKAKIYKVDVDQSPDIASRDECADAHCFQEWSTGKSGRGGAA
ncbi:MAG: thioredoxin domain-containing protein, partial [Raoultibacter sp.]